MSTREFTTLSSMLPGALSRATNPFPGLRPFETDEYRLFFGREGQSDELLARLERSRFLAVVGTSGSGKSSLVRAGLLPALRGGMMAGAGAGWRVAVARPGHDPLGKLAHALAEDGVLAEAGAGLRAEEREAVIGAMLRGGSLGLVDAARAARLEANKLLVVIDQFEELFRFRAARAVAADDEASAFVKLLLEAARQRDVPVYVVLTMRSDFLGDCAQFQGLPEAINDGQYLIPRMTRDERRVAIVGPVRVARARMTEPLVNRLLNDVGDNPDQLPILQHALMRTWDEWKRKRPEHEAAHAAGEKIDVCCYEAIGGMSAALSRHADEAYSELKDERSRHLAALLFKALTEKGADNREIRRPTRLKEICEIAGASEEEVSKVVEVFRREGRTFLMPPEGVALEPDTVIDISHESLIRNWERLKEWVKDEADAARIYRRLADAAAAHRAGESGLLDDVTLGWVNRWRERYQPNRAWGLRYHPDYDAALSYFEESRAAREREREERERQRQELLERERREREQAERYAADQRRAARRLRSVVVVLGVVFLGALAALVFAVVAERRAQSAQEAVERARHKLQKSRNAAKFIQSYEMEKAERELNELYSMTANDREGQENRAWVFYNLGELNSKLERHDQAAAFFKSALQTEMMIHGRLGLDSVGTLDGLGHALEGERSYNAAVEQLERLAAMLAAASAGKDKYFRLNTASVYNDLADLYLKQAAAAYDDAADAGGRERSDAARDAAMRPAREKAKEQYRKALAIWEEVLRDDPDALATKYEETAAFLQNLYYPLSGEDLAAVASLLRKALTLKRSIGTPLARKPIGAPNPGNDPAIQTQLAAEGPGYVVFNRQAEHAYGRPELVELLRAVAAEWHKRHPDIKLVVGDLSLRGGGNFPSHGGDHQDGREADVWPLTTNGQPEPTNIFAPNYSRQLTTELIQLINQMNPRAVVYFDDPPLVSAGLVRATLDHNNHMHVWLP
ncbi:MAG TPA: penicillin-insensitive murein endopeptidase [Pyrinomonadaceae bacterium]|nr:penicillin-insensitive murein endopeptidase [Pyrinomonadaceae bacterium]